MTGRHNVDTEIIVLNYHYHYLKLYIDKRMTMIDDNEVLMMTNDE